MSRDIKKDLADYEGKFGGTKSGIHTITCADIMSIVKRNIKGDQVYLPENFDYYEMICDALKIGYLMGYRKGKQRADFSKQFLGISPGENYKKI